MRGRSVRPAVTAVSDHRILLLSDDGERSIGG